MRFDRHGGDGVTLPPDEGRTTLCADVVDQSQLYGLLIRLRGLGTELAGVKAVPKPPDAS